LIALNFATICRAFCILREIENNNLIYSVGRSVLEQNGRRARMRTFIKGVLVGVGIGLLVAPMRGEEMRRLLNQRFTEWRNSLPPDSPVNKYVQEISERANYTKEHWGNAEPEGTAIHAGRG
jgi:hypothetical protein